MKKKTLRQKFETVAREYDLRLALHIGRLCEDFMQEAKDLDDWNIRGHILAKSMTNALTVHLCTLYKKDFERVRDFIVRGVNLDLRTIQDYAKSDNEREQS